VLPRRAAGLSGDPVLTGELDRRMSVLYATLVLALVISASSVLVMAL
jgi:hypothetical protein